MSFAKRDGVATRMRNKVARGYEWRTPFATALAGVLVEKDISLRTLSDRVGRHFQSMVGYFRSFVLPSASSVEEIEKVLGLSIGTLEQHIDSGERKRRAQKSGEVTKKIWENRRKNYGRDGMRKRLAAGQWGPQYQKGRTGPRSSPRGGPMTIQGRLRQAMGILAYPKTANRSGENGFVLCARCRKATYRRRSAYKSKRGEHFHRQCYYAWLYEGQKIGDITNFKHGTKTPDLDALIPYWLERSILGSSHVTIAERHGGRHDSNAVAKAVQNANDWLPDFWGELMPSKGGPTSIHSLLRNFPIREVVEIAKGNHPLSLVRDSETVLKWPVPEVAQAGWDPGEVANTPLAKCLAEHIRFKYRSRVVAAKELDLYYGTLSRILYGKPERFNGRTWDILSRHLDMPVEELKGLLSDTNQTTAESTEDPMQARIRELKEIKDRQDAEIDAEIAKLEASVAGS